MENPNERIQEPGANPAYYAPPVIPRNSTSREDTRYKSPLLTTILSLVPGLGQIYVGYYQQGFINIVVIAGVITLLNAGVHRLEPFFVFFMIFYWLFNMVDAYRKATFYNQTLAGLGPLEFPEGEQLPGARGSLIGGGALIVAGVIALSYTVFGLPLQWLERWWPLALILIGAWLLYQSLTHRKKPPSK